MPSFNWVDCRRDAELAGTTFNFFIGGRGTGKTYGVLKQQRNDIISGKDARFMYMRMTQAELTECSHPDGNPYRKINFKEGYHVELKPIPKTSAFKIQETIDDVVYDLGEARSIASFHNLRGVDFYDIKEIYFDEFIPVETVRRTPEIKQAGFLWDQAYETINRNRELEGEPPVRVYFTANAFSLDSSILQSYGLIEVIEHMQRTGQKKYIDREASILIELIERPDIAEAKKETALYKAKRRNKKLIDINLNNRFTDTALTLTKRNVKLIEYAPALSFNDELTLYVHKGTGAWYIAGKGDQNAKEIYPKDARGKMLLTWGAPVRMAMQDRSIYFDSADTYYLTERVFDKTLKVY